MRSMVSVVVLIAACGGGSSDGGGPPDAGADAAVVDGGGGIVNGVDPALAGNWQYDGCAMFHQKYSMTSADGHFTWTTNFFSDSDTTCTMGAYATKVVEESYSVVGAAASAAGAYNININTLGTTLKVNTASAMTSYNASSYCGFTDWAVGVAKSVAGVACSDGTFYAIGHVLYTIYRVTDRIQLGDLRSGNGSDASMRPTTLDIGYFTRP